MYLLIPSSGASGITVGTTTITGGTSGAIPFNSAGVYQEDAALLFWDNTNNRLGVGINAPTSTLGVKGSGATSATYTALFENSAGTDLFAVRNDGNLQAGNNVDGNLFIGFSNGQSQSASLGCTGMGYNALNALTTGDWNTAYGHTSLDGLTTASYNTAYGAKSLGGSNEGDSNSGFGYEALSANTSGPGNCAFGYGALRTNQTNQYSSAFGFNALNVSNADYNCAFGISAGLIVSSGANNTFIGSGSGQSITTASGSVFLGFNAGRYETGSSKLFIDNAARTNEATARTNSLIYGIFDATVTSQELHFNSGIVDINGRLSQKQGTDAASASTLTLTYTGNAFELTGTTAVTLITSTGWQDGSQITLIANENVTITNGTATSGANITIKLAGAANFAMTADDVLTLMLCTTTAGGQAWRETGRSVN